MSSTPLWVPLVVAALGLLGAVTGTVGGVIITQRRADRREATAWTRQQEREAEVWAREDAARTFEHRREAYTDFYEALRNMMLRVYSHGMGLSDDDAEELPWNWQFTTYQRLQHLEMYGTLAVSVAADKAYTAVWRWGHHAKYGVDDDEFHANQEAADDAERYLLRTIRRDLSIPEG